MYESDLLIVSGTSLLVSPVNELVDIFGFKENSNSILVVNREKVGEELGMNYGGRDAIYEGDCDDGFA